MLIGLINIKIFIETSASLKDKRRVVKSLIARLRNKFNISIAEIDSLESWQVAEIGIALVGNGNKIIDQQISQITNFLDRETEFEIIELKSQII